MEAKISVGQYQDIIRSVADITDICTEASAPTESVLWDKKYIYISQPVPHPVYIIVPAHGIAPGRPTANDLLQKYISLMMTGIFMLRSYAIMSGAIRYSLQLHCGTGW